MPRKFREEKEPYSSEFEESEIDLEKYDEDDDDLDKQEDNLGIYYEEEEE